MLFGELKGNLRVALLSSACSYVFIYLVTGPLIKVVKPRVEVAELEVSQVEVAGLKVETAFFYVEVYLNLWRWYRIKQHMFVSRQTSNIGRFGMNSFKLIGIQSKTVLIITLWKLRFVFEFDIRR